MNDFKNHDILIDPTTLKYKKPTSKYDDVFLATLQKEKKKQEREKNVKPEDVFVGYSKPSKYKNINSSKYKKK